MSSDDFTDDYATQAFADQVISDLEMRIEEANGPSAHHRQYHLHGLGTESAADAMPLMKKLVALKKRHDLSILLLAHTPKRALCNPSLTRNDLQGSKMLINFADSGLCYRRATAIRTCAISSRSSSATASRSMTATMCSHAP